MRNSQFSGSVRAWLANFFADQEFVSLIITVILAALLLWAFGAILAPVLISIAIAYLLVSIVKTLSHCRFPYWLSVLIAYALFIGVILAVLAVLPMLWKQFTNLVGQIPEFIADAEKWLSALSVRYPKLLTSHEITNLMLTLKSHAGILGRYILEKSVVVIPNIVEVVLYLILVPIMVFFFVKDSSEISHWSSQFLPAKRGLLQSVWSEVNKQIANYIRGRIIEIIVISVVTSVAFAVLGFNYALLLGALVGLSVIVPYIGAVVVTIPIIILGLVQWGWSSQFAYLMIAYAIIIVLDANVLVPLLFSEAMDLHPVAIIIAVLFFGGIWGFWGVFLAIPLATVVKALIQVWPRQTSDASDR